MKKLFLTALIVLLSVNYVQSRDSEMMATLKNNINKNKAMNLNDNSLPLIGVSANYKTKYVGATRTVCQAIEREGGIAVVIPTQTDAVALEALMSKLDGLVLTGGVDVAPAYYKETPIPELGEVDSIRDIFDLTLFQLARNKNVPVLGICRGAQVINVGLGGTLYQDIPSQKNVIGHSGGETNRIACVPGTKTASILGTDSIDVNSYHHQSVKDLGADARITAMSSDGVVEAIDCYPNYRILGVQFHPEISAEKDSLMANLFKHIVGEAKLYKTAKGVHSRSLSVDTHTDGPLNWRNGIDFGERSSDCVNLPKMKDGHLDSQFLAAWVSSAKRVIKNGKRNDEKLPLDKKTFENAKAQAIKLLNDTYQAIEENSDACGLAQTPEDVARLKKEGKKAVFLGVENGLCIGENLANISEFDDMFVKYITLCHVYDNQICHSSTHTEDGSKGLTEFGFKVVPYMNKLGIMVDLSHVSEGTFWDVIDLSTKPVICSHSGAKAIANSDRNLTDDQIRALAKQGGVVQVVAYGPYLRTDNQKATLADFIAHLTHIVEVGGIDCVGIGTDFDGGGGVPGLRDDADIINITMALIEKGYTEEQLAKILGGNFFRVMNAQK